MSSSNIETKICDKKGEAKSLNVNNIKLNQLCTVQCSFFAICANLLLSLNLNYVFDFPVKLITLFCQVVLSPNPEVYLELCQISEMG